MASIDKVDFPEGSDITVNLGLSDMLATKKKIPLLLMDGNKKSIKGACEAHRLHFEKEAKKNTSNGGMRSVLGEISLNTGATVQGNSGPVIIDTGNATLGSGGDFHVHIGKSTEADGGHI
eukprot:3441575-Ditylum_brightwellii.AAC.1